MSVLYTVQCDRCPAEGGKGRKREKSKNSRHPHHSGESKQRVPSAAARSQSLTLRAIPHFPGRDKWVRSWGIQQSETICMQSTTDSHIPSQPQRFPSLTSVPHSPLRHSRLIGKGQILREVFKNSCKFKNARNCSDPNTSFPFSIALKEAAEILSTEV